MSTATRAPAGRALRGTALLAEGAGVLVSLPLWFWWAAWRGGYAASVHVPGLAYLAFAVVMLAFSLPRARLTRPQVVALAALAALALWTALSVVWADDRGAAWQGATRTLLLLGSFAPALLWPPSRRALTVALAAFPMAAALGAASAIVAALGNADERLGDGRLVDPTDYPNAAASLFTMGALVAIALAARRELPTPLRAGELALGGMLAASVVLTQSRAIVAIALLALLVLLLLAPNRLRLLLPFSIAAVAVAITLPWLLAVRSGYVDGDAAGPLRDAAIAIVLLGAVLTALGFAYAQIDRGTHLRPGLVESANRVAARLLAAAALVAAIAFLVSVGNPFGWIAEQWDDFSTPDYTALEQRDSRFGGGIGSNRSDYWRVAVDLALENPLLGVGAENFQPPYLERRRSDVAPVYAHNVWLGAAAELGIPGLLALLAVCAALAWMVIRLRSAPEPARALRTAAVVPLVVLLLHGSVDWVTAFPALTVPAFALAACAVAPGTSQSRRRVPRGVAVALLVGALALTVVLTPLFLASRLASRAATTWGERPAAALDDLDRAQRLDPFSPAPALQEGVIAIQLGDLRRARDAFEEATTRTPLWYPHFQLGLIAAAQGRTDDALAALDVAAERDPRNEAVATVRARIERGDDDLDVAAITREVAERR